MSRGNVLFTSVDLNEFEPDLLSPAKWRECVKEKQE